MNTLIAPFQRMSHMMKVLAVIGLAIVILLFLCERHFFVVSSGTIHIAAATTISGPGYAW